MKTTIYYTKQENDTFHSLCKHFLMSICTVVAINPPFMRDKSISLQKHFIQCKMNISLVAGACLIEV